MDRRLDCPRTQGVSKNRGWQMMKLSRVMISLSGRLAREFFDAGIG